MLEIVSHTTQTLPRRSYLPECHTSLSYTRTCNFIYVYKKSTIFTRLVNTNQPYTKSYYTKYRTINVESRIENHLRPPVKTGFRFAEFNATHSHLLSCYG